jgi:hypothetical protein
MPLESFRLYQSKFNSLDVILSRFSNIGSYRVSNTEAYSPVFARAVQTKRRVGFWDLGYVLVALVLFGSAISAVLPEFPFIAGGSISIITRFFVAAFAVLLLVYRGATGKLSLPNQWPFIFALIYGVRLAYDLGYGDRQQDALQAMQFFLLTLVIPVTAISCIRSQDWNEKQFIRVMLAFGAVFFAFALLQLFQGNISAIGGFSKDDLETTGARLGFERMNPIILGNVSSTILIGCVVAFLGGSRRMKVVCSVLAMLSIYFLILAASRGPIVSLIGVLVYLLFVSGRGWWLALFAGAGLVLASFLSFFDLSGLLDATRFTDIGNDINSVIRFEYQAEAFESFLGSPVLGERFDLPISGGWPHNIFAEVLMATGIVGGFIFAFALGGPLIRSISASRVQTNMGSLILIQSLIGLQFSGSLWGAAGLWMGMVMVNAGLGQKMKSLPSSRQAHPFLR